MRNIITQSMIEEIIALLWIIAGLIAWIAGIKWMAYIFFTKGGMDLIISCVIAYKESLQERLISREDGKDSNLK